MPSRCPCCKRWFSTETHRRLGKHKPPDSEDDCRYEGVGELPPLGPPAE